jgi:hypothetical protein
MAVFAIPNPKKSLTIDFPIEQVKKGVNNLYLIDNEYKLFNSNEIFNQYTFESLEFLSLGVYIDINLSNINENKTEITIEVRRKIGTFNQSHEVTNANNHIQLIIENLSKSIILDDVQIEQLIEIETKEEDVIVTQNIKQTNTTENPFLIALMIIIIVIFALIGIFY